MRPERLAAVSGLLLALGAAVLLQQFAVLPLTVVSMVVVPVVVAAAAAVGIRARARQHGGGE